MIFIHLSDCLSPSSIDILARKHGLTVEQAFDAVATVAAGPVFQAEVARFQSTPVGRDILAQQWKAWDKDGLPAPWDNVLELPA